MMIFRDTNHHPPCWARMLFQKIELAERFRTFVKDADFPCVGAKSALARDQ
jgi:hypothetical protein